jgi:uncharacterized membrane protein
VGVVARRVPRCNANVRHYWILLWIVTNGWGTMIVQVVLVLVVVEVVLARRGRGEEEILLRVLPRR